MPHEREIANVVEKFISPLLDALSDRDAKRASRSAGQLTFWRDGMIDDLQKIATGEYDKKTIASLKKKFKKSGPFVEQKIEELRRFRDRLAPSKVADQIDIILHHDVFGKGSIRDGIQMLLWDFEPGGNRDGAAEFASELCGQIQTLNAELQRLGRMVRGQ